MHPDKARDPISTPALPEDLEEAIRAARTAGRDALLLRVQRRGQPAAYVPIRLR